MPSERFYIPVDLEGVVTITGPEHHHLAHVMRIRIGEEVEIVNGKGFLAIAKLQETSKRDAKLQILSKTYTPIPAPRLKLAIPLMRPAKLELVIEKCTELGADGFFLYPAHFSEKDELSEHQFERLEHIAISAMKQCGRLDLPNIELVPFEELFKQKATLLFGDTRKTNLPKKIEGEILFITGPEKGFSEKELKTLDEKAAGVALNQHILRAETAPIAATVIYSSSTLDI